MTDNNYILAMYDVRGKQDYIFRGKKMKEIVGGSWIIRDIFKDELFPAVQEYIQSRNPSEKGIYYYKEENGDTTFSPEGFGQHLKDGYLGEVIYDGGGNFFILYDSIETFRGINRIFTKRVLERTYSLTVLCSCIEGVDFDNYTTLCPENEEISKEELGDREKLYAENRRREARYNPQMPAQVLPFTWVDYGNSLPLYCYDQSIQTRLSRESAGKYEKYKEQVSLRSNSGEIYDEKILDRIVTEKGSDSWLAVVYIDGNNMGAKFQNVFLRPEETEVKEKRKVSYQEAVASLRNKSDEIQKNYVDDRLKAIDEALAAKYAKEDPDSKDGEKDYKRRLVVYAGDEINIVLNAHDAFDAVKAYFKDMPENESACAGIAIFKSHTPYAEAYRIAEECCENGKVLMKKHKIREANIVDFHYCQGAIGYDLDSIRKKECGEIISKPWFVDLREDFPRNMKKDKLVTFDMVEQLVSQVNTCTRTNIKGLLDCARYSEADLMTELIRMQVRRKNTDEDREIGDIEDCTGHRISHDLLRKLIYDIVSVYDLWFREGEGYGK